MRINLRYREGAKARRKIRDISEYYFAPSRLRALFSFLVASIVTTSASAAPKLEEVFKSTQENFGKEPDPRAFVAWLCVAAGVILALIMLHRRYQRQATPKVVNHQGKLNRALQKQIALKSSEVRQLKTLAEGQPVSNPLTPDLPVAPAPSTLPPASQPSR